MKKSILIMSALLQSYGAYGSDTIRTENQIVVPKTSQIKTTGLLKADKVSLLPGSDNVAIENPRVEWIDARGTRHTSHLDAGNIVVENVCAALNLPEWSIRVSDGFREVKWTDETKDQRQAVALNEPNFNYFYESPYVMNDGSGYIQTLICGKNRF